MSSWLNFNESITNLKGQISNFANTVLADDEEHHVPEVNYEELKKLCIQQKLEIEKLRKLHEEPVSKSIRDNGEINENSWNWESPESASVNDHQTNEEISDLKNTIKALESDRIDLCNQLEQLDSENQQNISELVGIKDKLLSENNELKQQLEEVQKQAKIGTDLEEIRKELSVLKSTHSTLEKILEDTKVHADTLAEKLNKSEAENKIIYSELQKCKDVIKLSELKSQEDAENCQKLAFILESYERQVSSLKGELEDAIREVKEAKTSLKRIEILEKAKEELKDQLDSALEMIKIMETQNEGIKQDPSEIEALQQKNSQIVLEKENLHKTYINIITENVKRYIDTTAPNIHVDISGDSHVVEFNKQVENIFSILSDLRSKCELLETENLEMSQEKTRLLSEKNHEIEKLLQSSEELSQEIVSKNETIKDLENEISELCKNNDLLMCELDQNKNAGLQTISESNEDNMVLLETQLEAANKKIEDLEMAIKDSPLTEGSSVEVKVEKTEQDYRELLNSFDDLKIDYDLMKNELENTKNDLEQSDKENDDIRAHLERAKTDFENTEYQLTEANITIDTLREELEACKTKLDTLSEEKEKLERLKTQTEKSHIDTKSELNNLRELLLNEENQRRELENQLRILTEKLQNAKMNETTLKLQLDTLNKDFTALIDVKSNLETTLSKAKSTVEDYEKKYTELLKKYDDMLLKCEDLNAQLLQKENIILRVSNELKDVKTEKEQLEQVIEHKEKKTLSLDNLLRDLQREKDELKAIVEEKNKELESFNNCQQSSEITEENNKTGLEEVVNLQSALKESSDKASALNQELQDLNNSRNELIAMVTAKHQESLTYHNEIQRLSGILKLETEKCLKLESQLIDTNNSSEQIEKLTDQNNFLKEKCEILAKNLLEEQGKLQQILAEKDMPSEKELSLSKQVERLQKHLMEIEEHYTQELLQAEQKSTDLQSKLGELERREKDSSTLYTSASIRANQQVETLQSQLQLVTSQREELRRKISDAEDQTNKQAAALANLQFVLDQFQRDKEKDVMRETDRIRRQISSEKKIQDELRSEILNLKSQLEDSKQGLQAASRLSDQLEFVKKQNLALKEEVIQFQDKLAKSEKTIDKLTNQTDGKVDKSLVRNLIVGFLSSGDSNHWNKDQAQILKIIATVLDFNQQDHDKVRLNKTQQGSWLGSILYPQSSNQNMSQESLSQAFIKFLESESRPRVVPSLLDNNNIPSSSKTSSSGSKATTPRASPIVLSEIVLPTLADFGQSRNSSSILKDVLKDNS